MLDFSERFLPQSRLDGKIQKPRPDDLHPIEELVPLRKILDDDLRDVVRRSLLRGCQGHGHGRGEISPFRPFGRIEAERGPGRRFQLPLFPGSVQSIQECAGHLFLHHAVRQLWLLTLVSP